MYRKEDEKRTWSESEDWKGKPDDEQTRKCGWKRKKKERKKDD